jgi:L-ascorbate metabolism protein UlaG (beta-lactamase superfamily)
MPEIQVQEAGWYQQYTLNEDFEIIFVPTRHWTRRGLADENKRLWGGFFIRYHNKSIYFMGDSGYTKHFEEIRNILGDVDYAIMGVGAYKPEWFMYQSHISPVDAIKAFHEMGGRYFIPMHFGTFDLSDEPLLKPLDVLREADFDELVELKLGEELLIYSVLSEE